MTKPMIIMDLDAIKQYLSYDPETGHFTWIKSSCLRPISGTRAGYKKTNGYIGISLFGKHMLAHRAAWAVSYGYWPQSEIDHINRVKSDNRLCNLRLASRQENASNSPTPARNRLGVKGVGKKYNKYLARIWDGSKTKTIGRFDTAEEAKKCYDEAIRALRGEFSSTH